MSGDVLERAVRAGLCGPFEAAFARMLSRLTGVEAPEPLLAAALAARAPREGHVCLDLSRAYQAFEADDWPWPDPGTWLQVLRSVPFVREAPDGETPLVLDGTKLYLERYYFEEMALAKRVLARRAPEVEAGSSLQDPVERAAALARTGGLVLVSGGPGTGKTTAAIRILAALASAGRDPGRFALLAPTGKAAARLAEAVREGLDSLDLSPEVRERFPRDGLTLHRALGLNPDRPFAPPRRRDFQVVVVDEASMMDLVVASRLFQATPQDCPVILLGDPHQLASVEAGAVFADLCEAAPLAPLRVHLSRVWRFGGAVADLAQAVVGGDEARVFEVLGRGAAGVEHVDPDLVPAWRNRLRDLVVDGFAEYVRAVRTGDAALALMASRRFRILCAVRRGPMGCETLRDLACRWLWGRAAGEWFPGRLVLVTQNDPSTGLFNGDTGVAVAGPEGLSVFFEGAEPGSVRAFAPGRLPAHEDALAITVHKAQGSQFDTVAVILPPAPSPILTRELLYTGVTRARTSVTLVASPQSIALATRTPTQRASGLRERLERMSA